jgi:hypothetical protein
MPLVGAGVKGDPIRPKYRDSLFPTLDWSQFYYGDEPWTLVGIQDVPPATDAALNANADVFELPANLDQTMGTVGVRNTVRNRLEAVNIPGTWVQTSTTYREVVRIIGAVIQFSQRFQGVSGIPANRWFAGGRTLDSTFGSLAAPAQQALLDTGASDWERPDGTIFHFDTSALTGSTTLRALLKSVADQYLAAGLPLDLEGPL